MEKTLRVGMMPGRINEYAVEVGTLVANVLELADMDATGYDVKVDGEKVNPNTTYVKENTSLILLARQVKGNVDKTVRVGMMPGRINEFAIEVGTSVADVLELAELDPTGYDVKVDGEKVNPDSAYVSDTTSLILLAKQVKGNKILA